MRDVSALHTLYSALIQATATILAIFAGLLTFSTLRGPPMGATPTPAIMITTENSRSA